jgi:hypothetical protein
MGNHPDIRMHNIIPKNPNAINRIPFSKKSDRLKTLNFRNATDFEIIGPINNIADIDVSKRDTRVIDSDQPRNIETKIIIQLGM